MVYKMIFRNAKKQTKDDLIFFLTMMVITAIMYSFHTLLLSEESRNIFDTAEIMEVMIGISDFFIILITAWLIRYMILFHLKQRSREFGIYFLLGMKRKRIANIYIYETLLIGSGSFAAGILIGILLRQILFSIFYSMVYMEYRLHLDFEPYSLLMTGICYGVCYLFALILCKRKIRKMTIRELMEGQRKNRTLRFTMGVLTFLFTLALLGSTIALMFDYFENQILKDKFPFDVQVYSNHINEDFAEEIRILKKETKVNEIFTYHIYENRTNQVNTWLYTHLKIFDKEYLKKDGTPDQREIARNDERIYCDHDTFMKLSDYNHLRGLINLKKIRLHDNEYAIHIKKRVLNETGDFSNNLYLAGKNDKLSFTNYYTEGFSLDGHNGCDYVIVVPDDFPGIRAYYSEMIVDISGKAPPDLQNKLDDLEPEKNNKNSLGHVIPESSIDHEYIADHTETGNSGSGSDTIVVFYAKNIVRDNVIPEIKYTLASITFPLFYMGLIFLSAALTVLSVQALNDSAKYRVNYQILSQIGYRKTAVLHIIFKQLLIYFICPVLPAMLISGVISVYIGSRFNFYTGVHTPAIGYYLISSSLFLGIYVICFLAVYIAFCRNADVW